MSWLTNIFSSGAGELVESIGKTVDRFVTTKGEKAQLVIELEKVMQERLSVIETTVQKEMDTAARIIEAEMAQDDPYTKRARPSIVYAGLAIATLKIIVLPFLVVPLFIMLGDSTMQKYFEDIVTERLPLEVEFFGAWTLVVGVYAWGRSKEKQGDQTAISQAMTGNGKGILAVFEDKK